MKLLFVDAAVYRHRLREPFRTVDHLRRAAATLVVERQIGAELPRGRVAFSRGLLMMASAARQIGCDVEYAHYQNETISSLREKLHSSDALALYAMTPTVHTCLKIARLAKRTNPKCRIAIGGPHCTSMRSQLLETGCIDAVGDERTDLDTNLEMLLGHGPIRANHTSLTRLTPVSHSDISLLRDDYSEPIDYSLLPLSLSQYYYNISTSRGCVYSCRYCSDGTRSIRLRSLSDLFEELTILDSSLPNGSWVHFFDSIFTFPRHRAMTILEWIASHTHNLLFSCDLKANHLDPQLARALDSARFRFISIGFETSNNHSLALSSKKNQFSDCCNTAQIVRSYAPNCALKAYWLLGLPGSSPQSVESDIRTIESLLSDGTIDVVGPKFLVPYPETVFYSEPNVFGLTIRSHKWAIYDRFHVPPVCYPNSFTPSALAESFLLMQRVILATYCKRLGITEAQLAHFDITASGYNGELYWRAV